MDHPPVGCLVVNDQSPALFDGLVIAVDGHSGSGKSSTSRGVASRLGLHYLDTGAMYRAIAWWMLSQHIDPRDQATVAARTVEPTIATGTDPKAPSIEVDQQDVSTAIRGDDVNGAVSPVAAVPEVRSVLLRLQRKAIDDAIASGSGIVVEGRDIGSVVAPDAGLKIFLTANASARAIRRAAEEGAVDVAKTEQSLLNRDEIDSTRTASPLVRADGAIEIDTTELTLDQVIEQIVELAHAADGASR